MAYLPGKTAHVLAGAAFFGLICGIVLALGLGSWAAYHVVRALIAYNGL